MTAHSSPSEVDRESLIKTIEGLSDHETIRDIAKALEDFRKRKFIEFK